MTRLLETWFLCFALACAAVILLMLAGCELPSEGRNYRTANPYYYTAPGMWTP